MAIGNHDKLWYYLVIFNKQPKNNNNNNNKQEKQENITTGLSVFFTKTWSTYWKQHFWPTEKNNKPAHLGEKWAVNCELSSISLHPSNDQQTPKENLNNSGCSWTSLFTLN